MLVQTAKFIFQWLTGILLYVYIYISIYNIIHNDIYVYIHLSYVVYNSESYSVASTSYGLVSPN